MLDDYQTGFGNEFASEAVAGGLPVGRNSPQRPAFGLYAEQLSGTAFTAPRAENRRSWLYRLRPSALQAAFAPYDKPSLIRSGPFDEPTSPNRLRWDPLPMPAAATDFIDGLVTFAGNGAPRDDHGISVHHYAANRDMVARVLTSADGEMLIVPQAGGLRLATEFGVIDIAPLQIALIPRGVRFAVSLPDGEARGYVAENHGAPLRLPDLGPIGSNGLANPRDFEVPVAAFVDLDEPTELMFKYDGRLFTTTLDHNPLDVVAWHGNHVPWRYDLTRFNTIGTVSFDHPDPSIFTVLTSPSATAGTANLDFVVFPPRWMVAEDTFRPPWFHRNVMSEYMGLITGVYDAKEGGFAPGGASLHNRMSGHGPDLASHAKASAETLAPHKIAGTMAFMFETRAPYHVTAAAAALPQCQLDYDAVWQGFPKAVIP